VIRILDIPLHDSTLQDAVDSVASSCLNGSLTESHCISATGAHGLVEARINPAFGQVLKAFAINLPDGMPVVWLARLKGAQGIERCYGPDFFRDVLVATASMEVRHFFCGGKEGIAEELRRAAEVRFGNRNCVGTYCPPFCEMSETEWENLVKAIRVTNPHIVWVGLSTPKQELFARELSGRVKVHFIITVGAAFDIHTGHLRQAPRLVQKMGLEWLFRLAVEPRRLWRRYARVVPLFFYYSTLDLLGRKGLGDGGKKRRRS
jgi:N-acetylglucosaminyldiphosphoundecaprenol N-acetyl-beta-D-mannosaminyltransferase